MGEYCDGFCTKCGTSCEETTKRERDLLDKIVLLEAELKKMKFFLNGTRI